MFLGIISFFKVILYLYYVLVVFFFYFVNGFKINNEKEVLYNDRLFFLGGGYLYWEVGSGGIWVILKNVFYFILMVEVVLIVCGIIVRENVI